MALTIDEVTINPNPVNAGASFLISVSAEDIIDPPVAPSSVYVTQTPLARGQVAFNVQIEDNVNPAGTQYQVTYSRNGGSTQYAQYYSTNKTDIQLFIATLTTVGTVMIQVATRLDYVEGGVKTIFYS